LKYILKLNVSKWNFHHHSLQSQSSDDPIEIILISFCAQETFIIIINVENSWAA